MKLRLNKIFVKEIVGNEFEAISVKRIFSLVFNDKERGVEIRVRIFRRRGKIVEGRLILSKF